MAEYIRRMTAAVVLGAALVVGACSGDDSRQADSPVATDSALSRDLLLAGSDTAVEPQLQDMPAEQPVTPGAATPATPRTTTPRATTPRTSTPRTTTPRTSTPRPSAGGSTSGGAVGTIASGTEMSLTSDARVCTNTYKEGSTFTATVAEAVTGSNGATIPAGAKVSLTVTRAKRSENVRDAIIFEFAVNSVSFGGRTYPLSASIASAKVDRVANQPGSKDAQKVAVGAAAGAIAGRVLGGDAKSTVIGGAIGAAAGAATAKATANYEGCVPDGGPIRITLSESVQVRA
jgi:hypothetical protein